MCDDHPRSKSDYQKGDRWRSQTASRRGVRETLGMDVKHLTRSVDADIRRALQVRHVWRELHSHHQELPNLSHRNPSHSTLPSAKPVCNRYPKRYRAGTPFSTQTLVSWVIMTGRLNYTKPCLAGVVRQGPGVPSTAIQELGWAAPQPARGQQGGGVCSQLNIRDHRPLSCHHKILRA